MLVCARHVFRVRFDLALCVQIHLAVFHIDLPATLATVTDIVDGYHKVVPTAVVATALYPHFEYGASPLGLCWRTGSRSCPDTIRCLRSSPLLLGYTGVKTGGTMEPAHSNLRAENAANYSYSMIPWLRRDLHAQRSTALNGRDVLFSLNPRSHKAGGPPGTFAPLSRIPIDALDI